MFSKGPNSKGSFFKRASSWKDKLSKQKAGSTPDHGRLHKATSLNDLSFQASKGSRVSDEATGIIGMSFSKIRLDDELSSGAATASPSFDSSINRYQPSPSSSKTAAKAFTGRSIPRPTFKSHLVDESNQELQIADQYKSNRSAEKPPFSSKACVDSPSQTAIKKLGKTEKPPFSSRTCVDSPSQTALKKLDKTKKQVSVRFSSDNTTSTRSSPQSQPPNQCIGCHGPLQPPANKLDNAHPSTSIKSPVSARHSTGTVAKVNHLGEQVSVRFSTDNTTSTRSSPQSQPPNQCIGCHGPLQPPTNIKLGNAHPSTSIKSPVSARHSTGNVAKKVNHFSQKGKNVSQKSSINCHAPLQTPTNRPFGDGSDGLSFNKSPISVRSSPGEASRSPQNQPGTSAVYSPGKQQTPTNRPFGDALEGLTNLNKSLISARRSSRDTPRSPQNQHGTSSLYSPSKQQTLTHQLKNPFKADESNPNQMPTAAKRQGIPHTAQQASADSRRGVDLSVESFDDYNILEAGREVLTSLQRDITQSLDTASDLPSGLTRRGAAASNLPSELSIDSLPSTYDTRLKIVEACQTRCLEYREMIRSIAESVLEKTERIDSSTVSSLASLYDSFVQLKANLSDFKVMCAKGGSSGDARAEGNLANEMTLFVQILCLNTMQVQNEVFLERLLTGFAMIRAQFKMFRVMDACSCCVREC